MTNRYGDLHTTKTWRQIEQELRDEFRKWDIHDYMLPFKDDSVRRGSVTVTVYLEGEERRLTCGRFTGGNSTERKLLRHPAGRQIGPPLRAAGHRVPGGGSGEVETTAGPQRPPFHPGRSAFRRVRGSQGGLQAPDRPGPPGPGRQPGRPGAGDGRWAQAGGGVTPWARRPS